MEVKSELLVAPITALEFIGDHLLAGEGPNLTIYSLIHGNNAQIHRQNVLGQYTIHGIKLCNSTFLISKGIFLAVFGSKGVIVLHFDTCDKNVKLSEISKLHKLHDWIWDTQWLSDDGHSAACLAVALGHNSVALIDYINGRILKEVHCSEKCILYSALFYGESWEKLVLVSGTVFNQLVIWSVSDHTNEEGRIEPRKRISGHNGVIFSICYEKQRGVLASASDDRSLRVWGVGDLVDLNSDAQCLLELYGHQSRVWVVKLLREKIISIGEDSACIVWNYKGDIIHHFKGHKGRGIRAVAAHNHCALVATGGADTGIRIWQMEEKPSANDHLATNFDSTQNKGSPKAIAMVDTDSLIVMTDAGCVFTYNLSSKEWSLVLKDGNYKSYSLLGALKYTDHVLCAIGNITGSIKIFTLSSSRSCMDIKYYDGKIHSLTWVSPVFQGSDSCNLFSSGPDGIMVWTEVTCDSEGIMSGIERGRFSLPVCKHRWHTSIAFVPNQDLIVCGDRRGSLLLYPTNVTSENSSEVIKSGISVLQADSTKHLTDSLNFITKEEIHSPPLVHSNLNPLAPVSLLFGIHGKLGVTSVICHDGFVYSTGRDGFYRQLRVEGHQLTMLRKQKSCKGMEWIEQLSFTPDGNLLVLGFHSTDFVVWSTRTNEKLHCIPCGGGHRSWSYKETPYNDTFVYIKSGDIFAYQSNPMKKIHNILKEPMHGRELTCVKHVATFKSVNYGPLQILITSSEDTTVNILCFSEVTKQMWQLTSISDHLSTVKTLAIEGDLNEECDSLSFVLFTAGGRAEIECYRVWVSQVTGVPSVSCQVVHLASHRLDEHWDRMKNKHRVVKMDPETRYMSVIILGGKTHNTRDVSPYLFLAAACSDGSVRFFVMCEDSRRIVLLAESFYHQRCVLKLESFVHRSADGQSVFLCSAATDGHIAFWDVTNTIQQTHRVLQESSSDVQPLDLGRLCCTVRSHQCGINSLHIRATTDGHFLVASGGDDNSIHISLVTADKTSDADQTVHIQLLKEFSASSAHAAHVTGLRILREDLLASVSVDQRLILWLIGDSGLQHLTTKFCHVADVAELDCWTLNKEEYLCVICGQGLEIIRCITREPVEFLD
ncbi:WD repeat-containing protein 6 [Bombina bombina]|uniref:WD repeat-containing protein 6 n=1 Tax=Bombina bombina TaxID=8345 RepID=UPI00235AE96F|nr:WD repeat-containing protein 6 [Bombina bombina]